MNKWLLLVGILAQNAIAGVSSVTLVDAVTDTDLILIKDGHKIDVPTLTSEPKNLNIRVDATTDVTQVVMKLEGPVVKSQTEKSKPFALYGNDGANYATSNLVYGSYLLTVTPSVGTVFRLKFSLSKCEVCTVCPAPTPCPTQSPCAQCPTPTVTPSASPTPTPSLSPTPTVTPSSSPTPSPTVSPSLSPSPSQSPTNVVNVRGYNPRGCGLRADLCGKLCNGTKPAPTGIRQVYVEAGKTGGDGSVSSPFGSIGSALSSVVDTDATQDVICISGTLKEKIVPKSGLPETYARLKKGNESFDFIYPNAPFMILGWDKNGNGIYPPMDKADIADFDGTNMTTWYDSPSPKNYVEVAHLRVKNYGAYTPTMPTDDVNLAYGRQSKFVYFHDLEMDGIHKGMAKNSNVQLFQGWSERFAEYLAVENVRCLDCSGYIQRGSHGKKYIRFKNLYFTSLPGTCGGNPECTNTGTKTRITPMAFKIWGQADFFEVLDSVFDANLSAYQSIAHPNGGGIFGFNDNVQDVFIKNNLAIDYSNLFTSQPNAKDTSLSCKGRFADRVLVEGNEYVANYAIKGNSGVCTPGFTTCLKSARGITIEPGDPWGWGLNYTFRNNKITIKDNTTNNSSSKSCYRLSNIAVLATPEQKALCPAQTSDNCTTAFQGSKIITENNECNLPEAIKVKIDDQKVSSDFSTQTQCSFKDFGQYIFTNNK